MHELSLCGAIADVASRRAGDRHVSAVHVRIGQLRQVVPDTLAFCWDLVVEGSGLAGAALEIERVPALLRCRSCAGEFRPEPHSGLACTACGGLDCEVLTGEELDVTALDLVAG